MRPFSPAAQPSSRRRGLPFILAAAAVTATSLWAWPTLAQDAGAATARQVMHEALEREAAQAVPPARLPDAARDATDEEALRVLDGAKQRGLSRSRALDRAAEAAAEGLARARDAQQAADEKLKRAGQAATTRSRADAAKKAAPVKPKPPRP